MPFTYLLSSWLAYLAVFTTLKPASWPFSPSTLPLASSLLLSALVHFILVQHFRHVPPPPISTDKSTLWPGGRQDWDIVDAHEAQLRLYSNGEALTCFALCWLPTLWATLGAITQNWALPLSKGRQLHVSQFLANVKCCFLRLTHNLPFSQQGRRPWHLNFSTIFLIWDEIYEKTLFGYRIALYKMRDWRGSSSKEILWILQWQFVKSRESVISGKLRTSSVNCLAMSVLPIISWNSLKSSLPSL